MVNDKGILPLNMYRTVSLIKRFVAFKLYFFFQSHGEKCGNSIGFQGKPYHVSLCIKFLLNVLKGLCHMKKVFSVHALIVFTIFCFFVDETIKVKVSACFFEITNFSKSFPLQRP
jgi:hypothetical protein